MADARVLFDIVAKDKASGAFDSAGKSSDGLKSKLGGLAKIAGGALVAAFGKASVDAFRDAEAAQNKLTAAVAKSPALAGASVKAFQDLNSQLARKTKFDDDATASGQAVLAQFNLTADQLKTLTPLLQDYAAQTGKDLPTAAQDLGKAILGQGRSLKAIGVDFKDTGSAAGNFAQLTDVLSTKVGGFAEKEGKTASGQVAIMQNQFGELQETIGAKLVPILTKLATGLGDVFAWLSNLSPSIQAAIGVVAGLAATAFLIVKATQAWTAVQGALNVVLSANPIGLVVIAIAALVAGLIYAYKNSETFRDIVQAAFAVVSGAVSAAIAVFEAIGSTVARVIGGAINFLKNNWQTIIVGILTGGIGLAVLFIAKNFDSIVDFVKGLPGKLASVGKGMFDFIANAVKSALNLAIRMLKNFRIPGFKIDPPGPGPTFTWPGLDPFGGLKEFAGGGLVPGPLGRAQLAIVHGGEQVLTPAQQATGAASIAVEQNFYGNHDAERAQRDAALELRKLSYLGAL